MTETQINTTAATVQAGMLYTKMKTKITITLLIGIILALSLVSAVTLDSGTTLNTTASNSSMTFDTITVYADEITIEDYNITIVNASYVNGDLTVNISGDAFWNGTNDNLDSSNLPYFSSATSTQKNVASGLSDDVTAVMAFDIGSESCDELNKITYNSHTGTYTQTWEGSAAKALCSGDTVTLPALGIEPAASSNQIDLEFDCTSYEDIIYPLIRIFASLMLLGVIVGYIYFRGGLREITIAEFILMFVVIFIGLAFIEAIADQIASRCSPA